MKIITKQKTTEIAEELIDLIASVLAYLKCMNFDLEHDFGKELLTKKIGKGSKNGEYRYSLRDRYGTICDRILQSSLSIAIGLGIDEDAFRKAIDEVVGNTSIYDGEYDSYVTFSPSVELLELDKGHKRWWKP